MLVNIIGMEVARESGKLTITRDFFINIQHAFLQAIDGQFLNGLLSAKYRTSLIWGLLTPWGVDNLGDLQNSMDLKTEQDSQSWMTLVETVAVAAPVIFIFPEGAGKIDCPSEYFQTIELYRSDMMDLGIVALLRTLPHV